MTSSRSVPLQTTPAAGGSQPPAPGRERLVDRLTWRLAIANLFAQIAIILTGGAVRLTGSGLGCSQWPMCEPGQFTPEFHAAMTYHPLVEFGNRMMTGVLGVIAIALVWAVYRRQPTASRPSRLKRLAWLPLAGIALQAVIGGMTVWADLHPAVVGIHMLISLGLVAVSAYLLLRLAAPDRPARPAASGTARAVGLATTGVGVVILVLGVITTGAGPHSGDAEVPYRWALDPAAISQLHAVATWAFVALVIAGIALVRSSGNRAALKAWGWLLAVTLLQGMIGYVQYFTGLPEVLVAVHMVGAALLVVALVYAMGSLYSREAAPLTAAGAPTAAG